MDNLIKKVLALNILSSAVVLFFVALGYREGGTAPILKPGVENMVDPFPQALMLTAIVISLSMTALALMLIFRIYTHEKTLSASEIERLLGDDS